MSKPTNSLPLASKTERRSVSRPGKTSPNPRPTIVGARKNIATAMFGMFLSRSTTERMSDITTTNRTIAKTIIASFCGVVVLFTAQSGMPKMAM